MYRVYIDEAGDRGHRPNSSDHFVVSAIVVRDSDDAAVRRQLATLRASVGRHAGHVLHFRNLTHSRKIKACQDIAAMPIAAITNVVLCKRKIAGTLPSGGHAFIKQADPMYLYAIRLLLERISWYVHEHGGGPAIVTFAHLTRFKSAKLHSSSTTSWGCNGSTELLARRRLRRASPPKQLPAEGSAQVDRVAHERRELARDGVGSRATPSPRRTVRRS